MSLLACVYELNGYLQLLRRLCKSRCDFGAALVPLSNGLEKTIEDYISKFSDVVTFKAMAKISYLEVGKVLEGYIYSRTIPMDKDLIKIINWDITEFFGLASIASNPTGSFNPILDGCWQAEFFSSVYEAFTMLIVDCEGQLIILNLGVKSVADGVRLD